MWNYAQALPYLFPSLERSMRDATLLKAQNEQGHQTFRTPLPIGPATHDFHAAADGQLGHVMRVYREWRISGDAEWMIGVWPQVRQSLDYCIETWDPERQGTLREPHHNTYDIEFWGPDGMCTTMYLGAIKAVIRMGRAVGDDVSSYEKLAAVSRKALEQDLFDGDFRTFLGTATGFGTVGVRDGKAFVKVKRGKIDVTSIEEECGPGDLPLRSERQRPSASKRHNISARRKAKRSEALGTRFPQMSSRGWKRGQLRRITVARNPESRRDNRQNHVR